MTPPPAATLPAPPPAPVGAAAGATATRAAMQVLALAEPLAGFPGHRDYVLVPADPAGRLFWLQSVAPSGPRFLVVPAAPFFPDYTPVLPAAACVELGLADVTDAELFCLVSVPDGDVAAATANLRAPVVVNAATSRARQVVLPDGRHPIRRPLRR
jgi:flagellar assembly factor FliW